MDTFHKLSQDCQEHLFTSKYLGGKIFTDGADLFVKNCEIITPQKTPLYGIFTPNNFRNSAHFQKYICDRILENGSKSHIFISLYLLLSYERFFYIFYIISYHYMEFNAEVIKIVQ